MPEYTYKELLELYNEVQKKLDEMENDVMLIASATIKTAGDLGLYPIPQGASIIPIILKKIPGLVIQSQTNPAMIKEKFSAFSELMPFIEKYKHLIPTE